MELVAAISGALILVVTVVRVEGGLNLGEAEYGWVMALYGLGATLASFAVAAAGKRVPQTTFILIDAPLTALRAGCMELTLPGVTSGGCSPTN